MPKEVVSLTDFAVMSPASNGGSIPVYCENVRGDLGKNILLSENTDVFDDGSSIVKSVDFWLEGVNHKIQIDSSGNILVDNTVCGSTAASATIDPVGDMVSVLSGTPDIITFDKKINKNPLEERPPIICEKDLLNVPSDISAIKKIMMLAASYAIFCSPGSNHLYVVNLSDGSVTVSGKITTGQIIDFTIDGPSIYLLMTDDKLEVIVQARTLASIGWESATFTSGTFEALSIINAGVFIDTGSLPSGAEISSIAKTQNKVFIAAAPTSSSNLPLVIEYIGDSYNFEMTEEQDLLFSLDASDVDGATATFLFSEASEDPAEHTVPLYKSRLPLMPYHLEIHDIKKGNQNNYVGSAQHIPVPYGFNHTRGLVDGIARLHDKKDWRPYGSRNISGYNSAWHGFTVALPGGCGLSPKNSSASLSYVITGKMIVLDYTNDICGMLVSSRNDMIATRVHEYGCRLRWVPVGNGQYDADLWNGLLDSGVGIIKWQQYISELPFGNDTRNDAIKVVSRNPRTDDTPSANGRNFIMFWNGGQTKYAGINYTLDLIEQISENVFEGGTPESPYGYNTGDRVAWMSYVSRQGTGWGFPYKDLEFTSKKHFDIAGNDTGCQRGVMAITSSDYLSLEDTQVRACSVATHVDDSINILSSTTLPLSVLATNKTVSDPPAYCDTIDPIVEKAASAVVVRDAVSADIYDDKAVVFSTDSSLKYYSSAVTADIALTSEDDLGTLKNVIGAEAAENELSGLSGVTVRYRYNFVYDGFQEGPLSSYSVDAGPVLPGEGETEYPPFRVTVTLSLPSSISSLYGYRITAINVYAARVSGDTEIELYRLVGNYPLDKDTFGVDADTGGWKRVVYDYGDRGASFENNAGYSEESHSPSLKRRCQTMCAGHLFVGGITPHAPEDSMYTGNIVAKSLPLSPSIFDYTRDFASLPFSPNVMRELQGRLYVFGDSEYAIINPDSMAVEHKSKTIGCLLEQHAVSNDYGLFVLHNNRLYVCNGNEFEDISMPIYSNELGIPSLTSVTGSKHVWFNRKRKLIMVVCGDGDDVYMFAYSPVNKGWSVFTIEGSVGVVSVFDVDNEMTVVAGGGTYTVFEGDDLREATVRWISDFGDPNQRSIIYSATVNSATSKTAPTITINGQAGQVTSGVTEFGQLPVPGRADIVLSGSDFDGAIDNIRILYRRLVAK